jgi:hypothetical protein
VLYDSDQGNKYHLGITADYTITDHRDLLEILDVS